MKPEIKTSLGALILILLSMLCLYLIAFSNQITNPAAVVVAVVAVAVAAVAAVAVTIISTWDKDQKRVKTGSAVLLWLIFAVPLFLVVPLSKYHNLNQMVRDNQIAEALKITVDDGKAEILLPPDFAGENPYLKKVLFIGFGEKTMAWKEAVIYCQEGSEKWFKAKLPLPRESGDAELVLFFDHAWKDNKIVIKIR